MNHNFGPKNTQSDLTRTQEQHDDPEHLNKIMKKRMEDSNDPFDYRVIIKSLDGALVTELRELEDSCLALEEGRQATENEKHRTKRTLRVLHGHLDSMQDFFNITPLPRETDQAAGFKVELALLGMVAFSVSSIIIEIQMQHFRYVQRVGALLCSSLFFVVLAQIFVLRPYYQQRERVLNSQ